MMKGGVQVNTHGDRFHGETQDYSEAAVHVLAQPGGVDGSVFDAPILRLARSFPDFCEAEKAGAVKTCAEIETLAALIDCNTINLIASSSYSMRAIGRKALKNTASDPLARSKRALKAPFYAVKVTGALFHTQGGLDIDARCRVLQSSGQPFLNLQAAGGAARSVSGNAVWGYLSSNGLLSAVTGGAIAAETAANIANS